MFIKMSNYSKFLSKSGPTLNIFSKTSEILKCEITANWGKTLQNTKNSRIRERPSLPNTEFLNKFLANQSTNLLVLQGIVTHKSILYK